MIVGIDGIASEPGMRWRIGHTERAAAMGRKPIE
jgi:hypothetical protein